MRAKVGGCDVGVLEGAIGKMSRLRLLKSDRHNITPLAPFQLPDIGVE